jgi:imidazoleglycerol-phosphate dehydratase/histidinol-phosphatase
MVTNQDGLGTPSFPEERFWPVQHKIIQAFKNEGIEFDAIHIDRSRPEDNAPTRKPGTGMLQAYFSDEYDLTHSFVIGDRLTDVLLAKNLGCKAILMQPADSAMADQVKASELKEVCALISDSWEKVADYLIGGERKAIVRRRTKETDVLIELDLDGSGCTAVHTGLGFADHMLEQIGKHAGIDLTIQVTGDLQVDEHHTVEDTALGLGEALLSALGNKRGIERYGYCLPMDDSLCLVALDFGGRPWLVWEAAFKREKIGDVPTELFFHFFKSLSDAARMNLTVQASGENEHHKIEAIFKAFARAIKMAIRRDVWHLDLPSTK